MSAPIYLDFNATTPVDPSVLEAMLPWFSERFGNPSSSHAYGKEAREAVDLARDQVASLIGCAAEEIVFTSGGTESNNLAIRGACGAAPSQRNGIVTSVVEHPATARPCERLEEEGFTLAMLPVDARGQVGEDEARSSVDGHTALVTVMLANNETGTLMPIPGLSRIAHEAGALMHSDAAQAIGKIPVRVDDLGVDLLSIAGHKLYAPKGVGALYIRKASKIRPLLLGAGHERGLRPGTENVPYIVALGKACEIAARSIESESARQRALRDRLLELLVAGVPGLRRNGHGSECLPNTLNVSFPKVAGNQLLEASPGIAASTGSACHAGKDVPSSVLLAMGLDDASALGAVRLSLGRGTSLTQVEEAASALVRGWMLLGANREDLPTRNTHA
jgi:cysteine desulfurase